MTVGWIETGFALGLDPAHGSSLSIFLLGHSENQDYNGQFLKKETYRVKLNECTYTRPIK